MKKVIFIWLNIVLVFTIFAVFSYINMDTSFKYHLYDEQNELVEKAVDLLNSGGDISTLVSSDIEVETTSQLFIIVYDKTTAVKYTNATYNEEPLYVPPTLALAKEGSTLQSIWNVDDMQFATASKAYNDGYVLVGKSSLYYQTNVDSYTKALTYIYGFACVVTLPIVVALKKICRIN